MRGADDHGAPALQCSTCHHKANFDPRAGCRAIRNGISRRSSMAWQGKTLGEICRQIKDPARNGGKTLPRIVEHIDA